jgi:outer membrane protein TolC
MFRKNSILVVLPLILACSNAFAWSWKDAVHQAAAKNPSIQAGRENISVIQLRYENAKALRLPRLSLQGTFQEFQGESEDSEYRAYLGPRLQWLIYQGGKVTSGIEKASAIERQAEASLRATSVATNFSLRLAFAHAIYAKNYLELSHRIERQRKENVKLTEIRFQSGLEFKWVYSSSTVKWKRAELAVQKAEMNKKTALADLEKVLGPLPIQSIEEISDDGFYSADAAYNIDQIVSNLDQNPKVVLEKNRVDEMTANIDYNIADQYPTIGVRADFWLASASDNEFFPFWWATLGLSMPIFEGGRIRRNISAAKAQLAQRTFELQQMQLNIKTDLQKNYLEYFISRQEVEISRLNVEATKDRAKVVSNQYRTGIAGFLDWERSQDDWVNSEVELINDIRDYQLARAKLEEAIGMEFEL